MQDNQQILKTQKFFINKEFCDLITSIDFNANSFRIGFTTKNLDRVMEGNLEEIIEALITEDQNRKLRGE